MNAQQAAQAYRAAEVESGDPLHRVVLLHERTLRALHEAAGHIERREVEEAHADLVKARQILQHFIGSIPDGDEGELAANLRGLFTFCVQQVVEANLRKDPRHILVALDILTPLGEAWAEMDLRRRAAPTAE